MEINHKNHVFEDSRGKITDILEKEPIEHITHITFKKGAIRGNHYHQESVQYCYMLQGKLKIVTQVGNGEIESAVLIPGDLALTPIGEKHAFEALEDSEAMVFTKGVRGGVDYEKDTYRLTGNDALIPA